jgi:prepilin-type N-terminal cleavage/methylation domain-containing protein
LKEKLLARLHDKRGFTLIELLVVIAIIAILVVIVVVAINPVERLNEANDREAQSNVRSTGTLIATCITKTLEESGASALPADCDTAGDLATYGNVPTVIAGGTDGAIVASAGLLGDGVNICAWQYGRDTDNVFLFESDTGETTNTATSTTCPDS